MWRGIATTRWIGIEIGRPRRSMTPEVRARYDRPPLGPPLGITDLRYVDLVRDIRRVSDAESRRLGRALDIDGVCVATWLAPDRATYEVTTHDTTGVATVVHRAEGSKYHLGGASIDRGAVAWWEFDDVDHVARLLRAEPHAPARILITSNYTKGSAIDPTSVHGDVVLAGDAVVAAVTMRNDGLLFAVVGSDSPQFIGHTFVERVSRDLERERRGRRAASATVSIDGKDGHGELLAFDLEQAAPQVFARRRGVSRGSTMNGELVVGLRVHARELEGPNGFRLLGLGGATPQEFESDGVFIGFGSHIIESLNRIRIQPLLIHVPTLSLMVLSESAASGPKIRGEYVMWTDRDANAAMLADPHDAARGIFVGRLDPDAGVRASEAPGPK